jgi:hypothetical protein
VCVCVCMFVIGKEEGKCLSRGHALRCDGVPAQPAPPCRHDALLPRSRLCCLRNSNIISKLKIEDRIEGMVILLVASRQREDKSRQGSPTFRASSCILWLGGFRVALPPPTRPALVPSKPYPGPNTPFAISSSHSCAAQREMHE